MDSNPEIVQPADWRTLNTVPVFLMHDGGGTTFAYHCLETLHRPVYGIHNPNFRSGEPYDGGLSDMARQYCGFIQKAIDQPEFPKRYSADGKIRIILGGWSMGGHLSLEMAKQLGDGDSNIDVIGILMVDTVYPIRHPSGDRLIPSKVSEEEKTKNQILADRAMADARRMIQAWTPPVWGQDSRAPRPRVVLLRAKQAVPMNGNETNFVDMSRGERHLGWDTYDKDLFAEVVDIEGHHFEVFAFEYIGGISETIKDALDGLERAALEG
ncbi:hypothetical protein F66182_2805 [Fusarium sp. NRRL 66182]|nr:hypothetical protein F66182_2805 [Fusarium sp. NRRL 66182]